MEPEQEQNSAEATLVEEAQAEMAAEQQPAEQPSVEAFQVEKPKKSRGWLKIVLMVIAVILIAGLAGGGMWYVMDQKLKQQSSDFETTKTNLENQKSELQKQIDNLTTQIKDTENKKQEATTNTTDDSYSASRNGVTLTITPTKGKVGTSVEVEITGLDNYEYTDLFFRSAGGWEPSKHQDIENSDGSFTGTYKIPTEVLTKATPDAESATKATATDKGIGEIVLTNSSSTVKEITVPFTVE